jgi:hypothetical protein
MPGTWEAHLRGLAHAPPALVARREMQRRTESKFVLPETVAQALLPALRQEYAVLPAATQLVASYRSLYFDTTDLELFHAHRRGRRIRYKLRIRHYPDRQVSFLEVKLRRGDGLITKARRPRTYGDNELSPEDRRFAQTQCAAHHDLVPQVWIDYQRITLLGLTADERVTIDFDLRVTRGSRSGGLRGVAVVEVKQPRIDRGTASMAALRTSGCRIGWASKYCAGIVLTSPEIRANRLLEGLRALRAVGTWVS